MKKFILLLPVLLVACASTPPEMKHGVRSSSISQATPPAEAVQVINVPKKPDFTKPVVEPVVAAPLDDRCASLAKRAKSIALARDAGLSQEDVELVVSSNSDYPLGPMIREVYSRRDITPPIGATNSYEVCTKITYSAMIAALVKAESEFQSAQQERLREEALVKKHVKLRKARNEAKTSSR